MPIGHGIEGPGIDCHFGHRRTFPATPPSPGLRARPAREDRWHRPPTTSAAPRWRMLANGRGGVKSEWASGGVFSQLPARGADLTSATLTDGGGEAVVA